MGKVNILWIIAALALVLFTPVVQATHIPSITETESSYWDSERYEKLKIKGFTTEISVYVPKGMRYHPLPDSASVLVSGHTGIFYEIDEITYQATKKYFVDFLKSESELVLDKRMLIERGGIEWNDGSDVRIFYSPKNREIWWIGKARLYQNREAVMGLKLLDEDVLIRFWELRD